MTPEKKTVDGVNPIWSDTRAREVPRREKTEGSVRVLIRWITKPHGKAGLSTHACASPVMPVAHMVATNPSNGSYGTRVFGGTIERPEGRGGGAD